jgi:hypothetical protein
MNLVGAREAIAEMKLDILVFADTMSEPVQYPPFPQIPCSEFMGGKGCELCFPFLLEQIVMSFLRRFLTFWATHEWCLFKWPFGGTQSHLAFQQWTILFQVGKVKRWASYLFLLNI